MKYKMKLPLKHKKDILKFTREFEKLACSHDIKVTLEMFLPFVWVSDTTYELAKKELESRDIIHEIFDALYKHTPPELEKKNREIKKFDEKVDNGVKNILMMVNGYGKMYC